MLDISIMAELIPRNKGVKCVKHNVSGKYGIVVDEKDENYVVFVGKDNDGNMVNDTWSKHSIAQIPSNNMMCYRLAGMIASKERYGFSSGGKRHTKRARRHSHKLRRKNRKTRRSRK
jgi:hypothetical protein